MTINGSSRTCFSCGKKIERHAITSDRNIQSNMQERCLGCVLGVAVSDARSKPTFVRRNRRLGVAGRLS